MTVYHGGGFIGITGAIALAESGMGVTIYDPGVATD